jgi:hypothetical protein
MGDHQHRTMLSPNEACGVPLDHKLGLKIECGERPRRATAPGGRGPTCAPVPRADASNTGCRNFNGLGTGGPCGMNLTTNGVVSSNISNEGTLRLRAGYLLTDRLLGYVTGGIAYGQWGASEVGGITGCAAGTCFNDYCCATINTRGWPGSCCERQSQAGGEHCHSTGT